jgi:hypothetical protein
MTLIEIVKHDKVIWERQLNLLKFGKYALINLCVYESNGSFGVDANIALTFPVDGHIAGVWFNLGKYAVHASIVSEP